MDINQKLKKRRLDLGLTMSELSKRVGVSEATISRWESGDIANMKRDKIVLLAKALNVTPSFIMEWDDKTDGDRIRAIPGTRPATVKTIPLFTELSCGQPVFADESINCYIPVGDDIEADFCLTANGDSMAGARINNGDVVFIQKVPQIQNGEIAAVWIDGVGTMLKRVYIQDGTLTLTAENPKYPPLVYTQARAQEVRLLGKAVAFQSAVV